MRLWPITRIARWEITTSVGGLNRRTIGIVLVLVLLGGAGGFVGLSTGGGTIDDGIYRVAVSETHPYAPAIEAHGPLRAVSPGDPAEVTVEGTDLTVGETDRAQAAAAELGQAIREYNQRQLRAESDQAAAFPVLVELQYVETQQQSIIDQATVESEAEPTPDTDTDEPDEDDEPAPTQESESTPETTPDDQDPAGSLSPGIIEEIVQPRQTSVGTPAELAPPFPFASLLLAFLFLVPLNFIIQAYGSTLLDERINRRGEVLLAAPVTPAEIVLGKTLPYALAGAGILLGIAVLLRVGLFGIVGVLSLVGLFLGATFVAALFARSYRELTFLTVAISVTGTAYAFVPAIFTDVTPVALISPLTLVVFDLEGQSVSMFEGLVSIAPAVTTTVVLFWLGIGIYRAENLFAQRALSQKALDMLAVRVNRRRDVAVVTLLLLPFVLLGQLFALALLFVLPTAVAVPVLLVFVSVIEEIAKSVHVFAAYQADRFDRSLWTGGTIGLASGGAFFIGETAVQLLQLAGLTDIELGQTIITPIPGEGPATLILLAAPLLLHIVTASLSALGASRGRRPYLLGLSGAILIHTIYNAGVITLVG